MLESPRRLAFEALPVAAILLFWNLLAVVAQMQDIGGPVRNAGVVMAGLYVVVRGVSLSGEVLPPATGDVKAVLYENAQLAIPAGAWFIAAMVILAFDGFTYEYGPSATASAFASALAGAGLGVVGLYAVAAGYRALDREGANRGGGGGKPATSDGTGADGTASDD